MSAFLGKAGMKLFEKHLEQYTPVDPMYEYYKDDKSGKEKRRKRELPPGLSKRDQKVLKSVKKRAHRLDKGFSICGFRFGWTFVIGVIPVVGDVADASLNYFLVVRKARQAELPGWLLSRMLFNNAVSAGVNLIPVAGDIVLAMYKANSRNAALLEEFLRIRGEEFMRLQAEGKDVNAAGDVIHSKSKLSKGKGKPVQGKDKHGKKVEEGTPGEQVAKGVSREDVEDVKPGAGREPNEVVGYSVYKKKGQASGTTVGNNLAVPRPVASTSAALPRPAPVQAQVPAKRSFWGGTKKDKTLIVPPAGERGRFVENVSNSH